MPSRSAPTQRICFVAAAALALLGGCATKEGGSTVRLQLVERTQLEMRLPPGWGHQASWDQGPRLGLVRLSVKGPETTQLLFTPRLNPAPLDRAQAQLEQARRELAASGECAAIGAAGAPPQQKASAGGVALYCTRSAAAAASPGAALLPALAGVMVNPRLTVRFKQLDAADDVTTVTWAIVDSLRATSYELSP